MVKCPYCDSKECEYVGDDTASGATWQCQDIDCGRYFENDHEWEEEGD